MKDYSTIFSRLFKSKYRRRFRLRKAELDFLHRYGIEKVMKDGRQFIKERIAPHKPFNDGKQTPLNSHPIFVAQHATAMCCRNCIEKWHGIPKGRTLTELEMDYTLSVLEYWISCQEWEKPRESNPDQQSLF